MSSRFFVSAALAASVFVGSGASGDIGTGWYGNWSSHGNWGFGYVATYGQSIKGNGELATGVRVRFYAESCCSTRPFRAAIARWDPVNSRAIGPILAQADSTYANYGCCWFDREVQWFTPVNLDPDADYVVLFTVSPWWGQYGSRDASFAIVPDSAYGSGRLYRISNQGNIASWYGQTWSDQGYDLNFTVRTTNDCDENGVVDAEELGKGLAADCNADGIIDSCQGERPQDLSLVGEQQEPIGNGFERQFLFPGIVPSEGDVRLTVHAYGDLSASHEFLLLSIAGATPTPIFTGVQSDCTWLSQEFTFTESQFDQFIAGGELDIRIGASGTVDPYFCGSSYVWLQLDYRERFVDCNGNRVPDGVDICGGAALDCNGNFIPDTCDLASGRSVDLDGNAQPDECQYDCNGDARPDAWQIAIGEYPDCNGNGVLDVCDLSTQASPDCNGNGIPDECDVAAGSVADCDGDIVPDQCAISSGLVPDCNGNGVPDGCEVTSGAVPDCNGNGVPDSCDVSEYRDQHETATQSPFNGQYAIVEVLKGVSPIQRAVELRLNYYAYTRAVSNVTIRVYLDQFLVVNQADDYWGGCYSLERTYWISQELWNQAAVDGEVEWRIETNAGDNCGSTTFCRGIIRYPSFADCNSTGIPDSCELAANPALDCDGNGRIDTCDIGGGAEDKNGNGHLDACELARGDLDLDGVVGAGDLSVLLALWGVVGSPVGDLTGDGRINAQDMTVLLGNWGTTP